MLLTQQQVQKFVNDGVLVVPNVLSHNEVSKAISSLHDTLRLYNIDSNNLAETCLNLNDLSSTHGAGGIIDLFYPNFRLDIATNPKIFSIVSQLWSETYGKYKRSLAMIQELLQIFSVDECKNSEKINSEMQWNGNKIHLYEHPFKENFDCNSGYLYMNRICFRVCDKIASIHSSIISEKKKRRRKLQRCLAPHLDCCPNDMFGLKRLQNNKQMMKSNITANDSMQRWRPIQLFISLTDNHSSNTGGFECVKGFHLKFEEYFKQKRMCSHLQSIVCVGDFCRLLPKQDMDIFDGFEHIPYDSGSLVLFDWRIPHANARKNTSDVVRKVIYTGFLPNVALNREYCKQQLKCYKNGQMPPDFWGSEKCYSEDFMSLQMDSDYTFSELGMKLMGIKSWV